jgi:soluble lytic murein transglycosylase-like protein
MKKHLLTLLMSATAMMAVQPAWAQSVVASHDAYGHPVYTDQDDVKPAVKAQPASSSSSSGATTGTLSRYSGLVYWSNKDHRWKPVPANNSSTMQAARKAAAEVDSMVLAPGSVSRKSSRSGVNSQPVVLGSSFSNQSFTSPEAVSKAIDAAAQRHGVDPNLVRAVVKVESNFNPHAVSRKGAMGLMQLMPYTARSLQVGNVFDPNQNVDAGVRHLKSLLENYNGNLELSLAAYNAGSGAVNRNGGIPPYRETRDYVKKITDLYVGSGFLSRVRETRDSEGHRFFSNND